MIYYNKTASDQFSLILFSFTSRNQVLAIYQQKRQISNNISKKEIDNIQQFKNKIFRVTIKKLIIKSLT
jgi:hypothetical protein